MVVHPPQISSHPFVASLLLWNTLTELKPTFGLLAEHEYHDFQVSTAMKYRSEWQTYTIYGISIRWHYYNIVQYIYMIE